jgi:hypothetical protein
VPVIKPENIQDEASKEVNEEKKDDDFGEGAKKREKKRPH